MNKILMTAVLCLVAALPSMAQLERSDAFHQKYKLREVVVFSRHNVRSPITHGSSKLQLMTPHEWHKWSSAPSELTLRGGVLETINGQFFRQWTVSEGLFPENARPTSDEVLFYANSIQRTIATAQYFSSGFMPIAGIQVQHGDRIGHMDPLFDLSLHGLTDEFRQQIDREVVECYGKNGLSKESKKLTKNMALLERVLDFQQSPLCQSGESKGFNDHNLQLVIEEGKEPAYRGSLGEAAKPADALLLQYYEEPDKSKATFGHDISEADLREIARIQDVNNHLRFALPCIAHRTAHNLMNKITDELQQPQRKFTFLCGHDTNIIGIIKCLNVKEYEAHDAIEVHTPIGSKIVFEKWEDQDGHLFIGVNHVYQSVNQIRDKELLTLSNRPMIIPLQLKEVKPTAEGLYPYEDFINFMKQM